MTPSFLLRSAGALLAGALLVGAAPTPARADTLADVQRRIEEAGKLVEAWIALASRDPRQDDLARYRAYTEEDFKKRDRIKAAQIAALIADKTADDELRLDAAKVLKEAAITTQDPDLAGDRRDNKKRKQWAKEHLVKLLVRDNEEGGDNLSRLQAAEILNAWFRGLVPTRDASDVANYDPNKKKSWEPAAKVWREALK